MFQHDRILGERQRDLGVLLDQDEGGALVGGHAGDRGYNTSSGQAVIWFVEAFLNEGVWQVQVFGGGSPGSAPSPWTIAQTGDFNVDSKSDILWYNSTSRQLIVWLIDGASVIGGGSPGGAPSPWLIQGMNAD